MEWDGKRAEWLKGQARKKGRRLRALNLEPTLIEPYRWILDAFWVLSRSRQASFGGPMPIPFGEIARYDDKFNVPDFGFFLTCIRAMDSVFLEKTKPKEQGKGK